MSNVMVLAGEGLNCQRETAHAFRELGAMVDICLVQDLLHAPERLLSYHVLAIPGGFSFGDDLGSGQVMALKMESRLQDILREFLKLRRPIIGICNGFQVLVKLGLLPFPDLYHERVATLTTNRSKTFMNRWVSLKLHQESCSIWTKSFDQEMKTLMLPIRHGEGALAFLGSEREQRDLYQRLKDQGQIVLSYEEDVNGSYEKIAAICDESGLVLGMMPHPEAYFYNIVHPILSQREESKREWGEGHLIFKSALDYTQKELL